MINTIMMANFNSIIKSLLWMMHSDNAILARIEFMVVMVSIITGTMSILDAYQRTSDSSLVKYIISLGNVISDSMFLYTVGLLESVPFNNDLFGVWAALLAAFRYGTNYAAFYGLDKEGHIQWNLEIGSAISSFIFIGDLYGARETNFGSSLLFLWALQPLRIFYMYFSFQLARRSYWQQNSSVLLSDYMWTENEEDSSEESNDPDQARCISRNSTRSSYYSEVHSESSRSSYYSATSRNADEVETQNVEFSNLHEVNQRATQLQVMREIEEVEPITNEQETDNQNHITSSQPRLEVGIRLKQKVLISSNKQYDPSSMRGYKYLIQGEIWQKVRASKFGDRIEFKVNNDQKLITLEKIWQSDGRLLGDKKLKDLCLSFALYRLLRCRFDDYALPEISLPKTRKLILYGVLGVYTGQVSDNIIQTSELEMGAKECEGDSQESKKGDREQEMDAKEQDRAPQVGDCASAEPDLSNVQGWHADRQEAGEKEPDKDFKEEKEELNDEQESPEERVISIIFWMRQSYHISISTCIPDFPLSSGWSMALLLASLLI